MITVWHMVTVDENAGQATVTVTRNSGTLGAASVAYATSDFDPAGAPAGIATPFATQGVDYTPASGVLTFADDRAPPATYE